MIRIGANHDIVTPKMEAETKSKSSRPACHMQVGGEIRNTTTQNHVDPTEIMPTQQKPSSTDKTQGGAPTITPEMARKHHAECVKEFSHVFNHKAPTFNSRNRPKDAPYHRIQLKDPNKSINGRMFTLPERYMNWMIEFIEHHLVAGHIRPSKSPISAGTWMIPKKGRTDIMPRVVHDYRALNENTIKDHTPLPRQDQILRRITRARLRGYIDLPDAYYQMHVHPDDIWKTAFKTPFGMYEWLVMPQGLCNAPATWQRYMNWILRDEIGRICYVYVDDIVIFSDTLEEHH